MDAYLSKRVSSQHDGDSSDASRYPRSEIAYFKRNYGSDHLEQLHDGHQKKAISRYALPHKREELERIQNQLANLECANDPEMTAPGRSAYSLSLLSENLRQYTRNQVRSLRWNQNYQAALASVADEVKSLCKGGVLKPMAIEDVAASGPIQKNLDKNAGYFGFETNQRSKGENLQEAVEWCHSHLNEVLDAGNYGIPLVISHRSSNSKPIDETSWKWRCRIILMQDIRALLYDGVFAIPFISLFKDIPWGEGGMTQPQVEQWIQITREHYDSFYSSDYSKFDVSQAPWLLEDVIMKVVRPCFGQLSDVEEQLFQTMCNSYIHKDIHSFNGIVHADGCQVSGSLTTYAYNTIVNEIVDRTVLMMQGCDYHYFKSLKCGDDNLTFYNASQPWDREKHCELIERYFGIKTTLTEDDCGRTREKNPVFLSREWTFNGKRRWINEVIWNLVYPERYRDYRPEKTNVSVVRAEALVLLSSCLEQDATMREYFDLDKIYADAQIKRGDIMSTYKALASMGTGFNTPWLNFKFGNLKS
jgi:hypothetical protein